MANKFKVPPFTIEGADPEFPLSLQFGSDCPGVVPDLSVEV